MGGVLNGQGDVALGNVVDALPAFSLAMSLFVLPLTVLTLGILTVRALRRRRSSER